MDPKDEFTDIMMELSESHKILLQDAIKIVLYCLVCDACAS